MSEKKEFDFNINDEIAVKLTVFGLKCHRQDHDDMTALIGKELRSYTAPKIDADGYFRQQMWVIMAMFGKHLNNGFDSPFETTIKLPLDKG